MTCTKLNDFDKENPNYQNLIEYIEKRRIQLLEDQCKALIFQAELQDLNILGQIRFREGMNNYLVENGYSVEVI